MTQEERRRYLISELLAEQTRYKGIEILQDENKQRQLLRPLMNAHPPQPKCVVAMVI